MDELRNGRDRLQSHRERRGERERVGWELGVRSCGEGNVGMRKKIKRRERPGATSLTHTPLASTTSLVSPRFSVFDVYIPKWTSELLSDVSRCMFIRCTGCLIQMPKASTIFTHFCKGLIIWTLNVFDKIFSVFFNI